ncbi:MAG: hypothetical protein FH753_13295 [Firmicutes bacterium]|nr:hypothetical protein [Bacillota bacterium]
MTKYTISIQSGLGEIENLLKKEGYEVCKMGKCNKNENISIIDVCDSEYEELESTSCRIDGKNKRLVINAADYTPEEILNLIKNNRCS